MTVYLLLLASSAIFGAVLCSEKLKKWGKLVYLILFALVFIFVSATRFEVGYDYNMYGSSYYDLLYEDMDDISTSIMEKGFMYLMYFMNLGVEQYYGVFIITSIINYVAVFFLIYKYSSVPWISVTAFLCFGLFFNSLCFLRQFIAALIVAYATKYIDEKNYFKLFLFAVIASSFHWSALLIAGLYFLVRIKPSWIYLGTVALLTVIFCIFSVKAMQILIENFAMYKGYDPLNHIEAKVGLPIRYTVMFGILLLLSYFFKKRLIERDSKNGIYINLLMFTTVFEAMGTRHAVLSRLAIITYIPPILFLVPELCICIKEYMTEKKSKVYAVLSNAAFGVFALACYVILMVNNYNGVMPYVSQFNRPYDIFTGTKITEEDPEDDNTYDKEYADEDFYEEFVEEDEEEEDEEADEDFDIDEEILDAMPEE